MARKKVLRVNNPKWEIYQYKNGFTRVLGYSNSSFKALYEGRVHDLYNVANAAYGPGNVVTSNVAMDIGKLFKANKKKFCSPNKNEYISFRPYKQ